METSHQISDIWPQDISYNNLAVFSCLFHKAITWLQNLRTDLKYSIEDMGYTFMWLVFMTFNVSKSPNIIKL